MNIFKKLLKIGQAEIHALVEKMENPIALIEQGIRDLKQQLLETEEQYAQVRAIEIRSENTVDEKLFQAKEYEQKAIQVLEKAANQQLEVEKADNLAYEALRIKKTLTQEVEELQEQASINKAVLKEISNNLAIIKINISKWEKELITLKTKEKISSVSMFANQQMSKIDNNSTIEMLERLKNKVKDNEALAEAYADLSTLKFEKEIQNTLGQKDDIQDELALLKNNMTPK